MASRTPSSKAAPSPRWSSRGLETHGIWMSPHGPWEGREGTWPCKASELNTNGGEPLRRRRRRRRRRRPSSASVARR
eukprot:6590951-Pyramimonas_sp.AAC.1